MYRYETHLHTFPVSRCGKAGVRETVEFYKRLGYDGIFITNHFLDGNLNMDRSRPYEEKIEFYYSDFEEAAAVGRQLGMKVFDGVEISYKGTDFLIYGLDKKWYLDHPEIMDMIKSEELNFLRSTGALVVQAHPFREARYIDHIRLFPRNIEGAEVINAERTDFENDMAALYAKSYGLLVTAGSDNHFANRIKRLAGMDSQTPINCVQDFIDAVRAGSMTLFCVDNPEYVPPAE